jgi:hypothetical protein
VNDIFISYANADRAVAQPLADAFEALGWSVWWDREIRKGGLYTLTIGSDRDPATGRYRVRLSGVPGA